jgi:hypothetical protein
LTLALNKFTNISLISIYSSVLSSEELDVINVHQLDETQRNKLRKTIIELKNHRIKKKKYENSLVGSTFENKLSKKSTKDVDLGSDLDQLLWASILGNLEVFKATQRNLKITRSLSFLQFWAVRLGKKSWKWLCEGIEENSTVKILSLNACGIDNVAFEFLVPALDKNTSIEILDLSYNYMGDDMACYIAKIISNEWERRDNVVWLHGLRGEKVAQQDSKKSNIKTSRHSGLQSLILRYNDFQNYLCGELSRVLSYDIYVRSIDLRNNNITEKGVKYLISSLKSNKILLNWDLRDNDGFIPKLHRKLAILLLGNLKRAQIKRVVDVEKWVNSELLTIEVPENMVEQIQAKLNNFDKPIQENQNFREAKLNPKAANSEKKFGSKLKSQKQKSIKSKIHS